MEKNTKKQRPSILMLPWLAHGHISPFLELAKRLTHKNFYVSICSTPINLESITQNLSNNPLIKLIELNLPSSPNLPLHYHTTKYLPPHLMSTLKAAFDSAEPSFSDILKTVKPNLLIYDFQQPWAPQAALRLNIPSVLFLTFGAATCSFLTHHSTHKNNSTTEYPFPALTFTKSECQKITGFMYDVSNGLTNEQRFLGCIDRSSIVLIKTSKDIESNYINYYSHQVGKEVVSVGPLVQDPQDKNGDDVILEWLNKKKAKSTVFVSFGSEYFLSNEEIEEIAYGLELSGVNFIWILRFHGGENTRVLHEALPEGFQERVGEKGMVVEGWAPQAKILGHGNIGGFMSHCGWSSTLESVSFGVPIIAMPMHLDQPLNAKLVVEIGVGLEIGKQNGRFKRDEVARVIKRVVVEEEGEEVRKKVREMSERMRGKCDQEVEVVVERLRQLIREI